MMKQMLKSFLNRIGIGAYIFPKTPTSDINKVEFLTAKVNDKMTEVAVRANGSDKHVFNQIFVIEEYKTVIEFMLQFKKETPPDSLGTSPYNIIDGGANSRRILARGTPLTSGLRGLS